MRGSLQRNYCLMQIGLWGIYGFLFAYANRYLLEQGLSNTEAGLLLGFVTALAFVLQPLLTALVDRTRLRCRDVMILSVGLMGLCCVGLLSFPGLGAQVVFYGAACTALQILPSFSNAMGMAAIHRGSRLNFGVARGLGGLSFGLAAQLAQPLMKLLGLSAIPIATALLCLPLALACLPFSHDGNAAEGEKPDPVGRFFRRNKSFALFLFASVLLYVGHNALCNCMFQIASFKGNGNAQGTATLISAVCELPVMFLFSRMLRRMGSGKWVCLSGIFMTLRLLLSLLLPGVWGLYGAQVCQMLGYALFAVSTVYYVGQRIDKRNVVKGQTYLGITNTLGCLIAHFTAGALIDRFGVEVMVYTFSAVSAAGAILLFASVQEREGAKKIL